MRNFKTMKKLYCICVLIFNFVIGNAQNLVPNGDFEQFFTCPSNWSQIDSALFWTTPTTNINGVSGTPDYFNQCSIFNFMEVPNNYFGHQQAHSGNAYAGLYAWYGYTPDTREYIEVPLSTSLLSGKCYSFEMYVNLGDISNYTITNIGIYFSDTILSGINNQTVLQYFPQIINTTGNYFDNQNWILVSGIYTALGGESFLTIGNFNNDATSDTIGLGINTLNGSYVYIDDVSLILLESCNTEIKETYADISIKTYPNPFLNILTFEMNNDDDFEITFLDPLARKIIQKNFTRTITLNTEQLTNGIYFYEVRNKFGLIKKGYVVKN